MYDDEKDDFDLDNEFCENCPFYRQGPPIFGPSGLRFPPPSVGPGPGTGPYDGPPAGPPPSVTPKLTQTQEIGVYAIDPGAIGRCINRFIYMQLSNGSEFWAWLNFVGRRSVSGWRWTGFTWVYFGVDLKQIDSFYCY